MAAQQQTPQSARIPPDVPADPGISSALGVYLRNFALWCRDGFAEQLRNDTALQGVMLRGYDTPAGSNPAVWMLEASGSGQLALAPVMIGSGKVGDPVPVGPTGDGDGNFGLGVAPPAGQTPPSGAASGGDIGGWLFGWGITMNNWANNLYYNGSAWQYWHDGTGMNAQLGDGFFIQRFPAGVADQIADAPTTLFNVDSGGNGTFSGQLEVKATASIISTDNQYAYTAYYDTTPTRKGWMGWSSGFGGLVILNDTSGASINVCDDGVSYFTGGAHFPVSEGWISNPDPNNAVWSPRVQSVANYDAYITFVAPSAFGTNFGLNANGHFYQGGWSDGSNYFNIWSAKDFANPACDYRFKDAIKPLDSTWDQVKALKPIKYRQREHHAKSGGLPLIERDDRERWGFLAHELQETLGPTAATGVKDIEDRLQAPNMNMVVAALVRTVQELQARVEELEAR